MTIAEHQMTDYLAAAAHPASAAGTRKLASALGTVDRWLGAVVETAAAAVVLVEIGIMLAGVIMRYVFHSPLIWSDELASILFLWLSMLGAVIALRRGEHMRMTGLVSHVGPGARAFLDTIAAVAPLALLALILHPAFDYASEEQVIVTPALEISNAWRAAAIPVGMTLMAVVAAIRLATHHRPALVVAALVTTALLIAAFWLAGPLLAPLGRYNLIISSSAWSRPTCSPAYRSPSPLRSRPSAIWR